MLTKNGRIPEIPWKFYASESCPKRCWSPFEAVNIRHFMKALSSIARSVLFILGISFELFVMESRRWKHFHSSSQHRTLPQSPTAWNDFPWHRAFVARLCLPPDAHISSNFDVKTCWHPPFFFRPQIKSLIWLWIQRAAKKEKNSMEIMYSKSIFSFFHPLSFVSCQQHSTSCRAEIHWRIRYVNPPNCRLEIN